MVLVSMLAAVAAGCLIVWWTLPVADWKPRWAAWLLAASLGAGLGIALYSGLYLLFFRVPFGARALPFAVLLASGALWQFRRRKSAPGPPCGLPAPHGNPAFRWNGVFGLALAGGLLLTLSGSVDRVEANPHGEWDAWSIWNLRAKFLAGPGDTWKNAISPLLESTHSDYPLLQSAFIASLWKASGETSPLAPVATAFLFFFSVSGLLIAALALLRATSSALLAGLVALTNIFYQRQPPAQYADIPLSFYYLATLVLVLLAHVSGRPVLLLVAGLFASCAAWTKNEGIAFMACVLACYIAVAWRSRSFKGWAYMLLGSLPGMLLTAYFKLVLAPAADPLVNQPLAQVLPRFADPACYAELAKALVTNALDIAPPLTHPLLLLAILAVALHFRIVPERRADVVFGAALLALIFAVYCGVYLASPNLSWQLSTSLMRLYCQLWPSFLLVAFMALGRIEDRAATPTAAR